MHAIVSPTGGALKLSSLTKAFAQRIKYISAAQYFSPLCHCILLHITAILFLFD